MADKKTYKELQAELDEVLTALQSDDVDVDEAIELYEKGMKLANELETYLKTAQNKVTKLQATFDKAS